MACCSADYMLPWPRLPFFFSFFCPGAAQRYEAFQPIRQTRVPGYKHLWGTAAKWLWIWPQTQRVRGSNTSTIPPDSREEAERCFHAAAADPLCSLGARLRRAWKHMAAAVYTVCTACIGLSWWKIYTQIKIKQKLRQRNGAESQQCKHACFIKVVVLWIYGSRFSGQRFSITSFISWQ